MAHIYSNIALGGTFDNLHIGHIRIINTAYSKAKHVTIGIMSQKISPQTKLKETIQSLDERKQTVYQYIKSQGWTSRTSIIKITDIYGPVATNPAFDAIIVTSETRPNALKINKLRLKNLLKKLDIITVPFVKGADNKIIRSTRIRLGIMNRNGDKYIDLFSKKRGLSLPNDLRQSLRQPLGIVIKGNENNIEKTAQSAISAIHKLKPIMIIAVGDIVSDAFQKAGSVPQIIIKDLKTRRKNLKSDLNIKSSKLINPPSQIRSHVTLKIKKAIHDYIYHKKYSTIIIKGEEDLLALPCIMLAPLGSAVIYGQWDKGIVIVPVDEKTKLKIAKIILKFL